MLPAAMPLGWRECDTEGRCPALPAGLRMTADHPGAEVASGFAVKRTLAGGTHPVVGVTALIAMRRDHPGLPSG